MTAADLDHFPRGELGNQAHHRPPCAVITRSKLAGVVVAGWVLVSLLPWWQLRVAYADQSGTGTKTISADVWRASTPAALAVIVAAVVSVVMVATRGDAPRTLKQRGTSLVIACLPVVLLGWTAWSIGRLTAAPHEYSATLTFGEATAVGDLGMDDYHVLHDRLEIETLSGYAEGPAWGLYVGVTLVLTVTAWAATRALKSPKP